MFMSVLQFPMYPRPRGAAKKTRQGMGERKLERKSTLPPSALLSPKKSCVCLCKPSPKYGRGKECVCGRTMRPPPGIVCVCVCVCLFSLRPQQQQRELEASFPPRPGRQNPKWLLIYRGINSASTAMEGSIYPQTMLLLYRSILPPLPHQTETKETSVPETKRSL